MFSGWSFSLEMDSDSEQENSVNVPNALDCTLKNGYNGKFYVTSILPQFLR